MKNKLLFVGIFIILIFPLFVSADDYEVQTLIPINTHATVRTDKFIYNDFYYTYFADGQDGVISFSSITNNTVSKTAVSINILLFNEEQKNIGFVTYCSDKDYSSNNSGFKLYGKQSEPFSINVVNKYFVDGFQASDVRYISVYDENKYCHIGGYDNYKGLTIDQIINGTVSKKDKINFSLFELFSSFKNFALFSLIIKIIAVVFFLYILGNLLNKLHERMYVKKTILAYVPIINLFISMKMAFGKIVSTIYFILCILACILFYFKFTFLLYTVIILFIISAIVNLFKFYSKKYDLFIIEPSIKTVGLESNTAFYNSNSDKKEKKSFFKKKKKNNDDLLSNHYINNDSSSLDGQNTILDLSYDDKNVDSSLQDTENSNDMFNVSAGEISDINSISSLDNSSNNNDSDSDLSKFFH